MSPEIFTLHLNADSSGATYGNGPMEKLSGTDWDSIVQSARRYEAMGRPPSITSDQRPGETWVPYAGWIEDRD